MEGNIPGQPDRNSITVSVRFKCNLCDFQCVRLPEAEQHSMKQHCTIQPFLCNTCTVSCKTYHDALNHLATPSAGHWRPPKMEERDLERWAQFQFVLTSYTAFLTVTCREDIIFLCCLCANATGDIEAAVKHLVSHSTWKRDNLKGHCDVCTFFYLSGINCIKQLRDFSGALNGCTHNIAACLLSNLKITLAPTLDRRELKSQTINWSALFSTKKPNISGNAVSVLPGMNSGPDTRLPHNMFGLNGTKYPDPMWYSTSHVQPSSTFVPPQAAMSWYPPGATSFAANPPLPSPTMFNGYGPPFVRPPRPEFPPAQLNPTHPPRMTFEQHMARERMLWLMDERYKRQMGHETQSGMSKSKMRRRSVPTSPAASVRTDPAALLNKSGPVSEKRSRKKQPITVIDLTDIEVDDDVIDANVGKTMSVDNVSSTTSNGETDKAPSESEKNAAEKNAAGKEINILKKVSDEPKDLESTESELHSTVVSDASNTNISGDQTDSTPAFYDEIFLEDDHGFYSDVPSEEDSTNHQILDLSVRKEERSSSSINTDIINLTTETGS